MPHGLRHHQPGQSPGAALDLGPGGGGAGALPLGGSPEKKEGFYQYSAAWDSKHKVTLPEGKTARVLFEMQEMQDGGEPI